MYPTLTDFFKEVFGINIPLPIQTYGFFVALAFLTGIFFLARELKRKEKEGILQAITSKVKIGEPAKISAIILSAIGGFIIGFKLLEAVLHYSDFVNDPQTFILSLRGNFIGGIIGAGISGYLNWREKEKQKLDKPKWVDRTVYPHEMAGNLLIVAAIFGLLGAKIFHNLENLDEFMADPVGSLLSFSGLTFLGGLIVGTAAVLYYAKKHNIQSLALLDGAAPGLALAYGVGRMGCQISGDGCWGIPNPNPKPDWMSFLPDWMWSYNYPHNVINAGSKMVEDCSGHCYALDVPVFPTPFYETTMMVLIFIGLWVFRKKIKIPGVMFMLFITLAGFERFFIEKIRVNNEYQIFGYGITQAEIISSILIIIGIAGIILFYKKGHQINAWLNSKMKITEPEDPKK
ncbi:MAG: prolipoprotein diacylglyceryl transferase [Bacteroidales bacterium]|nr:prolipoprotein diacylglyceryl transferase [Bacteroidales bacterium]